jgi:hypothetical protein
VFGGGVVAASPLPPRRPRQLAWLLVRVLALVLVRVCVRVR